MMASIHGNPVRPSCHALRWIAAIAALEAEPEDCDDASSPPCKSGSIQSICLQIGFPFIWSKFGQQNADA